jgi:ABC-type glycerol-3-phosphate transport system substrate-binding protein
VRRGFAASVSAALLLAAVQCAPGGDESEPVLTGSRLEVLGVWSGVEQRRFQDVLRRFASRTGVAVTYTSAASDGVPVALAARLAAGRPPGVAMLPQPGLLRRLAASGRLVPPGDEVVAEVRRNYPAVWRRLGSFRGRLFGVWFKAANKSLVWYDVAAFERAGVVPPRDLAGLLAVARRLADAGTTPFAVSARDGWTLTDWFEDIYLRTAGPRRYDRLARHRIPWTDPTVRRALRVMSALLEPSYVAGGVSGALRTGFERSVETVFSDRPTAAMVHGADFVAGVVTGRTTAQLVVDADVFPFPGSGPSLPTVVGGGDVAVMLRRSAAGDALLRYLASPEAAAVWAARGGFVSPNVNLDLSVYPGDMARSVARGLLDAGDAFRFDLSDLQPTAFGGQEGAGMQRELRDLLRHRHVGRAAAGLERAAEQAYADELRLVDDAAVTGRR